MKKYSVFTANYEDNEVYSTLNISASKVLDIIYGDCLFDEMSDEDFFEEEYDKYNIYNILDFLIEIEDSVDYSWIIVSAEEDGRVYNVYPPKNEVLEWWQNKVKKEIKSRKQNE